MRFRAPAGHRKRLAVAIVVALAVASGVSAVVGPPAVADFASQCGSPTRTIGPGSAAITVAAGETVLLTGGVYTGGVNSLPAGGTLCVGSGATLAPPYINNASGNLLVAAGANLQMPFIAVAAGFDLQLEGTAVFAGLNINGQARIGVATGGSLTISGSFAPGTGRIENAGTVHVTGSMDLNSPVTLLNDGDLVVDGAATVNGTLVNAGTVRIAGSATVNGSGSFSNGCVVQTGGDFSNNGPSSLNEGAVVIAGLFTNNGAWVQATSGTTTGARLVDDGRVTGFGRYLFTGTTSVQGVFTGDSAADPIVVDTQAPAGQFFDVQTGTVANLVRGTVAPPAIPGYPAPGCATAAPSADLVVSKVGPAVALTGAAISYTITAANTRPAVARSVSVVDTLPFGFTPTAVSGGGVVSATTVTWQLGDLAAGASVDLTVTGTVTADVGATLLDVVSGSSTTPDPDPSNNDGSSNAARVSTVVEAAEPPNSAPVASDQTLQGKTGELLLGLAQASDPDAGQTLAFTIATPPLHGSLVMRPGGGFAYRSAPDFTGVDTAVFRVCDDGTPVKCAQATLTFEIFPIAFDDTAETFQGQPVVVSLIPGDASPGAQLSPTAVSGPANGSVAIDIVSGNATYTPAPGFTGTDAFVFQVCSPTAPQLCDTATVTITVLRINRPPAIDDLLLTTVTGVPVSGPLSFSDPDGDPVSLSRGVPPRSGTATVQPDGTTRYTPVAGFAGRDFYTVIACSGPEPILCGQATVTVKVSPVAVDDAAQTGAGHSVTVDVLANDRGTVLAPVVNGSPRHGTATLSGTQIVYTPADGFSGTDSFVYTVCAAAGPDLCASATVTVTVVAPTPTPSPEPGPPTTEGSTGGPSSLSDTGSDIAGPTLVGLLLLMAGGAASAIALRLRRRSH